MARIPDQEIERLKSEVSVQRLAEARGVALKRHGADLHGCCPWHDDKTPSLVISPAKNLWHCLGACQAGGSVIDWVMKAEGVSFRHAVELLREGAPTLSSPAMRIVKQSTVPRLPAPVAPDADDQALLNQVIGYYHDTLKQCPEALAYLEKRGIRSEEAIERFRLGFANRTLGLRLPDSNRKAGEEIRTRLQRLGLMRESGHEHFNGSLVIPVLDAENNVTEVYGRKVTRDTKLTRGTPLHLYLPGPHRGVWNAEALASSNEIILCEALIDALTFWCAGYRNVTAAYGVEGFTDDHLAAFRKHGTQRVLIAYDRDDAGERAAGKLAERLIAESIECWRIQFPKGMDANDYALKVQPTAKSLGVVIRSAVWLGQGAAPSRAPANSVSSLAASVAAKEKTEPSFESPAPAIAEPALPASPVAPAPEPEPPCEVKGSDVVLTFGDRRYRVRGLEKNLAYDLLKVNLLAARGEGLHVDTLDLYSARARGAFVAQAATELKVTEDVLKADLGRLLLKLEALQDEAIQKALKPKEPAVAQMPAEEREAALALLRDPQLMSRLLADFEVCGLIGERINKLVGYLAATSRKLASPLAVVVRSSSAAGKSSLMDAVLALIPPEERIKYSAMTGQSLFYMGETSLKHKILAIAEEEGAHRASYALKLLQSEGELTIASTGKDPATGNLVTQEYRVEGPVMIFFTTTADTLDDELLNRCLVLAVDEGREQTQAIHRRQREKRTLAGLLAREDREHLVRLHQNAQRLLRPLSVLNPYAPGLSFPDSATRLRRAHEQYLTLIDTVALLHQHQREVKTTTRRGRLIEYVEVTLDDIALANELAHDVLGRSLDELPPQTRRLLQLLDGWVGEQTKAQQLRRCDFRFSRRAVRDALSVGDTQLKVHLARLTEMEYLIAHRAGAGFTYELAYDGAGQDGKPFVPGLIDVEALRHAYDANRSGVNGARSGSGRPLVGPRTGGGRSEETPASAETVRASGDLPRIEPKTHSSGTRAKTASYPYPVAARA